jgi:hypothetical protein
MSGAKSLIPAAILILPSSLSPAWADHGKDKGRGHRGRGHGDEMREERRDRDDDRREERRVRVRRDTQGFRGLDRNNDGVISRAEWRGSSHSFAVLDRNGDGVISASEFRGQRRR